MENHRTTLFRQCYITYILVFQILESKGRVLRIDESKDAIVVINGETYNLNPDCLVLVCHDDAPLSILPQPTSLQTSGM